MLVIFRVYIMNAFLTLQQTDRQSVAKSQMPLIIWMTDEKIYQF